MTEQAEEWEPWTNHNGKGCPVAGRYCQLFLFNGDEYEGLVPEYAVKRGFGNPWYWDALPEGYQDFRLMKYRVRKPRALVQMIKDAENLPSVKEREDA